MAGDAVGPQTGELAYGCIDVAGRAIHGRVRSQEWKPVLVLLDRPDGDVPSLDRVAILATRPKLSAVKIRVTIRALRAHILEDQFHVARPAFHLFVHSAKGIACLVVVEVGETANGFPTRAGVAALARSLEGTVRIVRRAALVRLRQTEAHSYREEQSECAENPDAISKGHMSPAYLSQRLPGWMFRQGIPRQSAEQLVERPVLGRWQFLTLINFGCSFVRGW